MRSALRHAALLFPPRRTLRTSKPSPSTPNPTMFLFLDWDETLSSHDTLALIAPTAPHPGPTFSHYTQAYLSDLSSHGAAHPPQTLREQFAFLASLDEVEHRSVARVQEGGLFRGWDPESAEERARAHVELRPGVRSELRSFLLRERGMRSAVISVGWSTRFIRAGLQTPTLQQSTAAADTDTEGPQEYPLDVVRANDPVLDGTTGKGTGSLTKSSSRRMGGAEQDTDSDTGLGIRTGLDKLREMASLVRQWGDAASPSQARTRTRTRHLTVYAGDSNTDLPCLVAASVGVVLAPQRSEEEKSSLLRTLQRLGFQYWEKGQPQGQRQRLILRGDAALQAWLQATDAVEALLDKTDRLQSVRLAADSGSATSPLPFDPDCDLDPIVLVQVADWVEGTRVLERLRRIEEEAK